LRRYLGKPRVKMEWQNLKRFAKWGIPTAEVVAWGLERNGLAFGRGAMITRELPRTEDLSALAERNDPRWTAWGRHISRQLAGYTRTMHDHRFTHNDLKWRNLLIDDQAHAVPDRLPQRRFLARLLAQIPDHQGPGLPGQGGQISPVGHPAPALLPAIPHATG
jgi:tRNA A-37 threonylcarbamoyl transferase component Bud32